MGLRVVGALLKRSVFAGVPALAGLLRRSRRPAKAGTPTKAPRSFQQSKPMPQNIILVGLRCTGKTTVGRLLAQRLSWSFADADDRIEAVAGTTIADIFVAEGEPGFRDREAAALAELCGRSACV